MYVKFLLCLLVVGAAAQSTVEIQAQGGIPGGSSAGAGAVGVGEAVTGTATVDVSNTAAVSSSTITATGKPTSNPPTSTPQPPVTSVPNPPKAPTPKPVVVTTSYVYPKPDPKVYVKKLESHKPEPKCGDIKDNMCPAISKFENCGYCILQKYPAVGYGCEVQKVLVKKEGSKGEYEVITKPICDCPQGALYIEDPAYCPTCELALMELAACAGLKSVPKNLASIEIPASCLEKIDVSIEFLAECKYIQTESKDSKKYVIEKPKQPETIIIVDPKVTSKKYVDTKITGSAASMATSSAAATVVGSATATAVASSGN